jgi:voltage-gated potassium channel Kch
MSDTLVVGPPETVVVTAHDLVVVYSPRRVVALLADYAIQPADAGVLFTNDGATQPLVATLPPAVKDFSCGFYVHAGQALRVQAQGNDIISIGPDIGNAAGYTESALRGSLIWLTAINGINYVSEYRDGLWSAPT